MRPAFLQPILEELLDLRLRRLLCGWTPQPSGKRSHAVIPSEARNLALAHGGRTQSEIPRFARNDIVHGGAMISYSLTLIGYFP